MTARELERSERDAFLDWRRGLAESVFPFAFALVPLVAQD